MNITQNLERIYQTRLRLADCLQDIANTVNNTELRSELEREIEDVRCAGENLRNGVFRLLILGDLKRGKSTFLNALIGEKLLPSDVNPCTAILTILRYGEEKQVIVYFKGTRNPEYLDLATFKQKYTINPDEAKQLEQANVLAFPDVDYAVIEYPLPLLAQGVEIIDSPGLNDTEARNKLSLGYVYSCQAVLFVLRAIQPLTLDERRYLNNYLKNRGLSIFFLINGWDEISKGLIDLEDRAELEEAEHKVRQVFRNNLAEYCQVNGQNLYSQRVFEISALQALRRRLKNPDDNLDNTGFAQFTITLDSFLTQERASVEFRQAKIIARQICDRLSENIARRIPLLSEDVETLKTKINSVQPEFEQLKAIRNSFREEITNKRDRAAKDISNYFQEYVLNLGDTFEIDFVTYQPNLEFFDFLRQNKREEFNQAFKQAFERYLKDKLSSWELIAEKELELAFLQLAESAASHGANYRQLTNQIDSKLIGEKIYINTDNLEDNSPGWAKWAMGFFSLATGNVAGVALAAVGFSWKNILVNWLAVIGITSFLAIFFGIVLLNPIGIAATSLGVGAIQTDRARKELLKTTKKEFIKTLPTIAQKQKETVRETIEQCFDNYKQEVTKRIDDDIKSRQSELNNLLQQQQTQQSDRDLQIQQLRKVEERVTNLYREIERV